MDLFDVRIVYFLPGHLSATSLGPEELERRRTYLDRGAFPGTQVEVHEARAGPTSLESATEEVLAIPAIISGVHEIEASGADAVIIGSFDDPGLAAARELVSIPVIGPAQASCHLAAQLGDRFAVLTVVDQVIPLLRRLLRSYGLEHMIADMRAVQIPVLELQSRPGRVLSSLKAEGKRALEAGADTLVLGGMTIGFLGVAPELQQRLGVPVIDPVLASLKMAESAVSLSIVHSRRAFPALRKAFSGDEVSTQP